MNLGFTGTRAGMTEVQERIAEHIICQYLTPALSSNHSLHHGDCIGADEQAHDIVTENRPATRIIIHPPQHKAFRAHCKGFASWQPKPFLQRNQDIVVCCERLIACPSDDETIRSGTWSTIRYARKKGKPTTIVWPNGSVTEED